MVSRGGFETFESVPYASNEIQEMGAQKGPKMAIETSSERTAAVYDLLYYSESVKSLLRQLLSAEAP